MTDKIVLDATCGSRMMWFDKNNPNALYADIRNGSYHANDGRILEINPDVQIDYTNMPFDDNSFYLVVLDPPHRSDLTVGNWMEVTYGKLFPTWEDSIRKAVNECMRVLKPNGVLIFKWNEKQIKLTRVLAAIDQKPLFGHTAGKTIWMTFIKTV